MPKTSSRKPSTSDSDSGPNDLTAPKKTKPAPVAAAKSSKADDDEDSWEIGRNRHVKLTEFKGKWYINIREYYMADGGDMRPGKKGIMLPMEQWEKFKNFIPEIQDAIKRRV